LVASLIVDPHRGEPGRSRQALEAADVNIDVGQSVASGLPVTVGADTANKAYASAIASRRDRLVRTLATNRLRERRRQYCLTDHGQAWQAKCQVDIDRTKYDDHRWATV
jgi:hypothetical protein